MKIKALLLSHYLNESTPGYGGKKAFYSTPINQIPLGHSSNSQEWRLSNHVGTHVDLPLHFDSEGKKLNDYAVDDWIFHQPFLLNIAASSNEIIEPDDRFESIPMECDFLILKTEFQKLRNFDAYWSDNPGLSPDLGIWLRKKRPNLKAVGFDFISLSSFKNRPLGRKAHWEFLCSTGPGKPLRIIEDMKLDELTESPKMVVAAPALVESADGSPITVIAFFGI